MNIDKEFPSIAYMEAKAKRTIPGFARDYLVNGLGGGVSVRKNREALDAVELMPRYLSEADQPNIRTRFLGHDYNAPFGVAPMGLSGLVWPRAERILAQAAKDHNIPYTLSTVATASLEEIRKIAGENAWFQLYTPQEPHVLKDILRRCDNSGYETVMVTVDVPYKTRREHDIRNGLSVPPRFDLVSLWQMMTHPGWSLRMLASGVPQFVNLTPYQEGQGKGNVKESIEKGTKFIEERMGLHITPQLFRQIRDLWPRKLFAKGVLDPAEAKAYMELGADGVIVSNHGGRQLDAAPAAATMLPEIRSAVGPDAPLLVDGGVRSGLDVARMLALGADFVLIGRPFLYSVAALDRKGGYHAMEILKAELQGAMGQLGAGSLAELPSFLVKHGVTIADNHAEKAVAAQMAAEKEAGGEDTGGIDASMNQRALDDLIALLSIEGPPAHEGQVAAYIRQRLLAMGVAAGQIVHDNSQRQSEYGGEVGNLIVRLDGARPSDSGASSPRPIYSSEPRLMFSTHMDTVPIAVGYAPRLDGDRIVNDAAGKALGGDNRLGCAALLDLAAEVIKRKGDHPPVTLVFFVQEEVGLVGTRGLDLSLLGEPLPSMCYNLDGGKADEFVTQVIGAERFTIDVTGIAAHAGAHPADGVSAAVIAARAIAALEGDGWHGRIVKPEGVGTANVGIINGGQGSNVVMPSLHILAEARSHDPAFRRRIIETWKAEFRRVAAEVANRHGQHGSVTFGSGPIYEAFALKDDEPTVQRLLQAAALCGMTARTVSNDGGMDANWIVAHGIPAVTLGVGQRDVHTPAEWIDLNDFAATCDLIRTVATIEK